MLEKFGKNTGNNGLTYRDNSDKVMKIVQITQPRKEKAHVCLIYSSESKERNIASVIRKDHLCHKNG